MNKNFKIIIFLLGLAVLFLIFNLYSSNKTEEGFGMVDNNKILENEDLETYKNEKYHFSVQYPSSLSFEQDISEVLGESDVNIKEPNFIINFNDKDSGFNFIKVSVFEDIKFASLEDWLKTDNQLLTKNTDTSFVIERVLEKTIKIDNVDAIVTFVHSNNESDEISKHDRKVAFIKNGNLFVLSTRFAEDASHEKVWESFSFTN